VGKTMPGPLASVIPSRLAATMLGRMRFPRRSAGHASRSEQFYLSDSLAPSVKALKSTPRESRYDLHLTTRTSFSVPR